MNYPLPQTFSPKQTRPRPIVHYNYTQGFFKEDGALRVRKGIFLESLLRWLRPHGTSPFISIKEKRITPPIP